MAHGRIDVHQHLVPNDYAAWLRARGVAEAGGRALPAWSAEDALLAELARREAVVFVHPSTLPAPPVDGVPPFAIDFLLDPTQRAAVDRNAAAALFPALATASR